jgi:hypothetical protein
MSDTTLRCVKVHLRLLLWSLIGLMSCQTTAPVPPIAVKLYQAWELQPGDRVSGYAVIGGLGDITIDLQGQPIYAPFTGETRIDKKGCVFFSTPDIPAYLFRWCGLTSPKLGAVKQGEAIGGGKLLQFAALRKQPNGTWAIVEPARKMLEKTLSRP